MVCILLIDGDVVASLAFSQAEDWQDETLIRIGRLTPHFSPESNIILGE